MVRCFWSLAVMSETVPLHQDLHGLWCLCFQWWALLTPSLPNTKQTLTPLVLMETTNRIWGDCQSFPILQFSYTWFWELLSKWLCTEVKKKQELWIYIKYFISYTINNTKNNVNCDFNFAFLIFKYKYIFLKNYEFRLHPRVLEYSRWRLQTHLRFKYRILTKPQKSVTEYSSL